MAITIESVQTKKDLRDFMEFPFGLYKGDPYWVPPFLPDHRKELTEPYSFIDSELFLARRDGKIVGRIGLIINNEEVSKLGKYHARFNWYECIDDDEVSTALIDKAMDWARERKMKELKGPFGYTNLDAAAFLVEGFDHLPTINAIYNKPYYIDQMEKYGFSSHIEWHEHLIHSIEIKPRVHRIIDMVQERYQLRLHKIKSAEELREFIPDFFSLLNDSYQHLEGFIPIHQEQKDEYTEKFIKFINPDFVSLVIDKDDRLVSFAIAMPSFSKAMQKANGRLFPLGWYHLMRARKHNDAVDLLLIAVHPDYRGKGIPAISFRHQSEAYKKYNIQYVFTNPEQATNANVINIWKEYGGEIIGHRRNYMIDL